MPYIKQGGNRGLERAGTRGYSKSMQQWRKLIAEALVKRNIYPTQTLYDIIIDRVFTNNPESADAVPDTSETGIVPPETTKNPESTLTGRTPPDVTNTPPLTKTGNVEPESVFTSNPEREDAVPETRETGIVPPETTRMVFPDTEVVIVCPLTHTNNPDNASCPPDMSCILPD